MAKRTTVSGDRNPDQIRAGNCGPKECHGEAVAQKARQFLWGLQAVYPLSLRPCRRDHERPERSDEHVGTLLGRGR